ncbi:MAG: YqeG family HAD IIIA-type phosphatase [Dethiobacteria bacterium]|jgi:HAD superfamily phosphatase (TIGR01668 family)
MQVWKLLCPWMYVSNVHKIELDELQKKGIRGIIIDLDNTLVPWNGNEVFPEVLEWMIGVKERGFKICIVSNNDFDRGNELAEYFDVPAIWKAVKPRRRAFRQAIKIMGLKASEVAVVGDQVFTDILGGNRLGLYTILVLPMNKREFFGTRCVRQVEKIILFALRRKGLIK